MLESLLRHKKEEKDYLVALVISDDRIDAALWETTKDGKATVVETALQSYEGDWDKAIDAADGAVTSVEEGLPEGIELTKVVFGLFPEWLQEDHIKEERLKKLKQLTTALSLTPVGFVELPTAVAHLLNKDEGTQQTVILVGIEEKYVTVSLYKIGKQVGTHTVERAEMISADIEKALGQFTDVEVLPSRILLFGVVDDLEAIKTEMLSYPWQKKANFLHFPKIEALSTDYAVKSVAIASATELTPHEEEAAEVAPAPLPTQDESPSADRYEEKVETDDVAAVAQDLGFVKDQDVGQLRETALAPEEPQMETEMDARDIENVAPIGSAVPSIKKFQLPKFTLPKLSFTVRIPKVPKVGFIAAIVVVLLLLAGSTAGAVWFLPKATVTVLVQPQVFDKTEEITIDTSATSVNTEDKILPGATKKLEVDGSQSVPATGKKTIGDKAKGEVTIFNKTLNTKTFKAGTKLTSGKLAFTLDSDVTIASASESGDSLKYGNAKGALTASAIGTASNLPAESDFTFEGLPSTSYTARNDKALAGGTSKDILVVTRDDQRAAREAAVAALEGQAEEQLLKEISGSIKLLDNSLQTKVVKETFSKEIGEEATAVEADVVVAVEAATYDEKDFYTLLDSVIASQIASGYEYKKENSNISIGEITVEEDGIWMFKPHIKLKLLPKIETKEFAKELAGKTFSQATDLLRSKSAVAGAEYKLQNALPFMQEKLPTNPANISIELSAL